MPNKSAEIRHLIVPYTRGRGVDLGCGPERTWPHVIGVDDYRWARAEGESVGWRPDLVDDAERLDLIADDSLDFVLASYVVEYDTARPAVEAWWRKLKRGGHLIFYAPTADAEPSVGFNPGALEVWLTGGCDQAESEVRGESVYEVYTKASGSRRTRSCLDRPQRAHTCLVVRYGGFGDMLQASATFPALRKQGWHVVVNTTEKGHDILKADPNISDWWMQDADQVPNEQLGAYWQALGQEFGKVVNLSESVEGTLLALPGRRNFGMPKAARKQLMGTVNYAEFQDALADVQPEGGPSCIRFYPTTAERRRAQAWVQKRRSKGPLILYALAGSSVHKVYPWADSVLAWLLAKTPATIALVGGPECRDLEVMLLHQLLRHFEAEGYDEGQSLRERERLLNQTLGGKRIACLSGEQSIRETLALAQLADCVVGPETGVLNAVSSEPVAKVCFLSHSSRENLTKHWVNTTSIEPDVHCYPCHRLHYDRSHCPQDEASGAAICAASLKPETVFRAILDKLAVSCS